VTNTHLRKSASWPLRLINFVGSHAGGHLSNLLCHIQAQVCKQKQRCIKSPHRHRIRYPSLRTASWSTQHPLLMYPLLCMFTLTCHAIPCIVCVYTFHVGHNHTVSAHAQQEHYHAFNYLLPRMPASRCLHMRSTKTSSRIGTSTATLQFHPTQSSKFHSIIALSASSRYCRT
jgi:hypothetical protein